MATAAEQAAARATALIRLRAMTGGANAPTLTAEELDALLDMSQLADIEDLPPSDALWTPTYNLNIGAAEGWRWKMAKAVGGYDFSADGATYNRSQIITQCKQMLTQYQGRLAVSVRTSPYIPPEQRWTAEDA